MKKNFLIASAFTMGLIGLLLLGVKVEDLFSGGGNGPAAKVNRVHRAAKNKRSLVVQELFEKLPPQEQRIVLKQIKLMAQQAR